MRLSESEARAIANRLRRLLRATEEGLTEGDVESVTSLIDAGEYVVALENLCTQIYEYDVEIDVDVYEELVRMGDKLGVAAAYLLGDPWANPPC